VCDIQRTNKTETSIEGETLRSFYSQSWE